MSDSKLYIGVDLGTSAVKLLLVDEKGRILGSESREYPLIFPQPGWCEQEPAEWWRACTEGIHALLKGYDASRVAGIGCGGQMHGLVVLDEKDQVIRPTILWNDGRTEKEVEYLNEELRDAYALADILLSRAGSNSLSEILAVRKPALLIPYHSGRGDQVLNAESLRKRGLANVLPQGEMTAYRMVTELRNLYNHRDVLQRELDRLPDADGTQAVLEEIHAHCR